MKNKVLIGISLFLGTLILFSLIFYVRANRPMSRAKKEAIEIAKEYSDLNQVNEFYWFTREKTYFTLTGTDSKGKEIIVIIPQSGEKVSVLDQESGLTENEALKTLIEKENPHRIAKINLGLVEQTPTWEVVVENEHSLMDYYLLDFKTGKIMKTIKNV